MANGFGAGFGGLLPYAVLLATMIPLIATAGAERYWRENAHLWYIEYAAGVLTAVAAVTTFAVLTIPDKAPPFAALAGDTDSSTPLLTALAGVVATAGTLLADEYLHDALCADNTEP